MSEIKEPNQTESTFVVELTEYDLGWGSKLFDTKYFENETEAKKYVKDYNEKYNNLDCVPDWYVRADYVGELKPRILKKIKNNS